MTMDLGCVACLKEGFGYNPADVQHMLNAGKRISHSHTYPLCPWHHRGIRMCSSLSFAENKDRFGPSFALSKVEFREKYGTDDELLEFTNQMIEQIEGTIL